MDTKQNAKESGKHNKLIVGILAFIIAFMVWVSLSLSEQYTTTIEIPIKITNLPPGYSYDGELPEKLSVTVKLQGWKLLSVNSFQEEVFIVPAPKDLQTGKINFKSAIAENTWLSGKCEIISVFPEEGTIRVSRAFSKVVRICPDIQFVFREGFGLVRPLDVAPDSIIITGTRAALEKIDSVLTEPKKITDIAQETSFKINLRKIPGITYSEDAVLVNAEIQKILDRDFFNVPVEVINLPPDREVVFYPDNVTLNVRGGLDILGKLHQKDFRAVVDYKEIISDSLGVITPNVILPPFVEKNYLEPRKIRVVIKKL